jgi:hypothetical protein
VVTFRENLPQTFPVYISVDGENYVLRRPEKLVLETNRHAQQINVLRGPIPVK